MEYAPIWLNLGLTHVAAALELPGVRIVHHAKVIAADR